MIHDALKVLGANLAVNVSSFVVLATAARLMPIDGFAELSLIVGASQMASSALDLGTNFGVVKKYSEAKEARFLSSLVWLKLAVTIGCLALIIFGFEAGMSRLWLSILMCAAAINLWTGARALEQAQQDFSGLARSSLVFAAIRTVLGLAGIASGNGIAAATAFFVGPLVAVAITERRKLTALVEPYDRATLSTVMRYALPTYVSALLYNFFVYWPQFVIFNRLDAKSVAMFGLLLTFLGPLALFNTSIRLYLLPRVASNELKRDDMLSDRRIIRLVIGIAVAGLAGIGLAAFLADMFYGPVYPGIGWPLWIFVSCYFLTALLSYFNLEIHRMGKAVFEALFNAGRLAVLIFMLWAFGHDLLSVVIISAFMMLAGECLMFILSGRMARHDAAAAMSLANVLQTPTATAGLRFAVVCADLKWQPWQQRTIEQLCLNRGGQLVRIVCVAPAGATQIPETVPGSAPQPNVLTCVGTRSDDDQLDLSADALHAIQAMNLDFALLFGFERCGAALLDATRQGVWTFPGFGSTTTRYVGPAFWPILSGTSVTTVTLVRLGASASEDAVLKRGTLCTDRTYGKSVAALGRAMSDWPLAIAKQISNGCALTTVPVSNDERLSANRRPTTVERGRFAAKLAGRQLEKIFDIVFRYDIWHIGVARCEMRHLLADGPPVEIDWAPRPPLGYYYADPMVLETPTETLVLAEFYSYWTGKGDIHAFSYSAANGWSATARPVITEPFHLSYPMILDTGTGTACLPECTEAGVTYLYPLDAAGRVCDRRRAFTPFPVADPTMVEHDGHWYLFGAAAAEAQHTLRIWYADSRHGPWTPHPANPVICDVQTARPAGPFVRIDNRLFRPSQSSSRSYGSSANLMEVLELSPKVFRETRVRELVPHVGWPYPDGLHTLSGMAHGVVIDAKVTRISPIAVLLRLVNAVQSRRRRRRPLPTLLVTQETLHAPTH